MGQSCVGQMRKQLLPWWHSHKTEHLNPPAGRKARPRGCGGCIGLHRWSRHWSSFHQSRGADGPSSPSCSRMSAEVEQARGADVTISGTSLAEKRVVTDGGGAPRATMASAIFYLGKFPVPRCGNVDLVGEFHSIDTTITRFLLALHPSSEKMLQTRRKTAWHGVHPEKRNMRSGIVTPSLSPPKKHKFPRVRCGSPGISNLSIDLRATKPA